MKKLINQIYENLVRIKQSKAKLITFGFVESATGGKIADSITGISGISEYFKGSIVAYSNEIKENLLGINPEVIEIKGAVSLETAVFMAESGKRLLSVDVCISDTGIAGPTGSTGTKPVGLFFIALYSNDHIIWKKQIFTGDRNYNKKKATNYALNLFDEYLISELLERQTKVHNVVTCFIRNNNKVLIVKRSQKVGTYRGRWSAISGYIEMEPLQQAILEIQEEVGLQQNELVLTRKGIPFEIIDKSLNIKWIVHPFLFDTKSPEKLRINWENTEISWIIPEQIKNYETVPGLEVALENINY